MHIAAAIPVNLTLLCLPLLHFLPLFSEVRWGKTKSKLKILLKDFRVLIGPNLIFR